MIKISVIVPIYNVQDYLEECLDSILRQDFSDYEVILVDDGSTDRSGTIAEEYAERGGERVRVVHQANGGLGAARNTGIELAQGDYLTFVDSDDTIEPNMLSRLYEKAMEIPTGADIVIGGFYTVTEANQVVEPILESLPCDRDMTLETNPELLMIHPSACGKIYRRILFTETGIRYPSRVWYEDIRTTPKVFTRASSFLYVDEPLYRYRLREGSITKNKNTKRNEEILWAFEDLLGYFRDHNLWERYHLELEYLAVFHVLLTASVRVARIDPKDALLTRFLTYVQENFPAYRQNPYLSKLEKSHMLLLHLIEKRRYGLVRLLFQIKDAFDEGKMGESV